LRALYYGWCQPECGRYILTTLRNIPKKRGLDRDLVYLLQLTKKHGLTPAILHTALTTARKRGRARAGKINVDVRQRNENSLIFMFSLSGKPLGQAKIPYDSIDRLRRLPEEFRYLNFEEDDRDLDVARERAISELKLGLKSVSFKAHVVRKSEVRAVTSREGNPLLVCSVTLSDGTGEIPLVVWNGQISAVSEGDVVEIHDARVRNFRGEMQLALSRKTGALTVLKSAKSQIAAIAN